MSQEQLTQLSATRIAKPGTTTAERKIGKLSRQLKTSAKPSLSGISIERGDVMERPQLPPEFLQRIREVLAAGIAKNIVAKALADLQPQGIKGQET